MRKVLLIPLFIIVGLLPASCEEVVRVDMDTAPARLVIEASINWQKGSNGEYQYIRLSTTAAFYSDTVPVVTGAIIHINNSEGKTFNFTELKGYSGIYACTYFEPKINETYNLTVVYKNETYKATETLLPVPDLLNVDQETGGGINGDIITVKAYFNDPANEANYYMNRFIRNEKRAQSAVIDDRFTDGNKAYAARLLTT